jgi:hypothetical protein
MSPALPITPPRPERVMSFTEPLATDEGWAKQNRHYWQQDYPGFLEFFFGRCFTEPHSTKQIEDGIGWALETTPDTLELTVRPSGFDEATSHELMSLVRCPVLVIQGTEDALIPADRGAAFAAATGGRLVTMEGAGHGPHARDPVRFNLLVSDFANTCWGRPREPQTWRRAVTRSKRALYISSPIGLGHAWRDLAIVRELRRLDPALTVDWLAQDPVTRVLERVAPHRGGVRRSPAACVRGDPEDGRDPARQLHGLPRRRPLRAVRPLDRRRGVGARLLPA